jgi:hypothetical protein
MGFDEKWNEALETIKLRKFLDQPIYYHFLKKNYDILSYLDFDRMFHR